MVYAGEVLVAEMGRLPIHEKAISSQLDSPPAKPDSVESDNRVTRVGLWSAIGKLRQAASNPYLLLVLGSAILYTIYWSNLTVARFESLHAHIFDLGATAEEAWLVLHSGSDYSTYWGLFSTHAFAFVLAPLEVYPSYPALLWVQSASLASGALAIYGIAKLELRNGLAGALIAESYLVFFPVSGMNWFDAHFEIFIVPLFLWGYYFYSRDRAWPAYVLFSLTAVSQFPYGGYTALFAAINLTKGFRLRSRSILPYGNPTYWRFDAALLTLSVLSLLSGIVWLTSVGSTTSIYVHVVAGSGTATTVGADSRLIALVLIFAPFLFLPLVSPRWSIFLVPGVVAVLFSTSSYWVYPALFFTQYTAVIVPFAYLGLIDAVRRGIIGFGPLESSQGIAPTRRAFFLARREGPDQAVVTALVVLIAVGLVGTVYDPYGPYNNTVAENYGLPGSVSENATISAAFAKLLSLIPQSNPDLLVQNNMPQAYPRPLGNNGIILITGSTVAYNYTYLYENRWIPAQIDYVLTDPWDYTFTYQGAFPYNLSMETALQHLYEDGSFGVVAEAYGLILLGRNYSGPAEYYVPQIEDVGAAALSVVSPDYRNGPLVSANNVTNHSTIWYGPYSFFLQPGLYNITYSLLTTNNSPANQVQLDVHWGNSVLLNSTTLYGSEFSQTNTWVNVTTPVYINNFYDRLNFGGDDAYWLGKLSLGAITITQVGAASALFVEGVGPQYQVLYGLAAMIPANSTVVAQPGLAVVLRGDQYETSTQFNWNESARPQYILGDPFWPDLFTLGSTTGQSMFTILQSAFASHRYGVLAMAGGATLLSLGRTAPPELFTPVNQTILPVGLFVVRPSYKIGSLIVANNVTDQSTVWYGPYEYLPPGAYSVTFQLSVTNTSASNFLKLDVLAGVPLSLIAGQTITGTNFTSPSEWTNITVHFTLPNFSYNLDFSGDDVKWSDTLALQSITITQTAI